MGNLRSRSVGRLNQIYLVLFGSLRPSSNPIKDSVSCNCVVVVTGGQVPLGLRVNLAVGAGGPPPRAIYRFAGEKVLVCLDLIDRPARLNGTKKTKFSSVSFHRDVCVFVEGREFNPQFLKESRIKTDVLK